MRDMIVMWKREMKAQKRDARQTEGRTDNLKTQRLQSFLRMH